MATHPAPIARTARDELMSLATIGRENVAVCASDMPDITFYTLPSVDELTGEVRSSSTGAARFFIHSAFSQVASTSLAHVLKHQWRMPRGRNISDLVVAVKVPCWSVRTLLERHRLAPSERLIMTVDAEGQDLAILESAETTVGLSRFDLFQWEYMHVDRTRHCEFMKRAVAAGFACDSGKSDAWCVRRSALTPSLALGKEGSCRVQHEPRPARPALTPECTATARQRFSRYSS